jgi:hypothetical protein
MVGLKDVNKRENTAPQADEIEIDFGHCGPDTKDNEFTIHRSTTSRKSFIAL